MEQTFDFCEKELIGQSHEGQDMIVMKVKAHYLGMFPDIKKKLFKTFIQVCKGGCGNKPAMWIDRSTI